jgi:hypothetical protein
MWVLAIIMYIRATRARKRTGIYAFWIGAAVLTLAWLENITVPLSAGGSAVATALTSLAFFLVSIAWAYWINQARPAQT